MPVVVVQLWEGRSVEQKRLLAKAITDAMVQLADASPTSLHVVIEESSRENWARGGVLAVDMDEGAERPPAVFKLDHALLQVADLERAEAFYCGTLGFGVRKRESFPDGRPLVVTEQGLGLTTGGVAGGAQVEHLAFRSRDVAGWAQRLRAAGVELEGDPAPSSYGVSLYLRDPDGNRVELFGLA